MIVLIFRPTATIKALVIAGAHFGCCGNRMIAMFYELARANLNETKEQEQKNLANNRSIA